MDNSGAPGRHLQDRAEKVAFVEGDEDLTFADIAQVIDKVHAAGVDKVGLITAKIEAGRVAGGINRVARGWGVPSAALPPRPRRRGRRAGVCTVPVAKLVMYQSAARLFPRPKTPANIGNGR